MYHRLLHYGYRLATATERWVLRRFTWAGYFVLFALTVSAGFGLDTNLTMAYQSFTFLLSLLLISIAWSVLRMPHPLLYRRGASGFAARRILPRFGTVGVPLNYQVVIRNGTSRKQGGLLLLEDMADPRPTFREFSAARDEGGRRRNWLDRMFGYARWTRLVARRLVARVKEQLLPMIAPEGETELTIEMLPARRGHVRFTGMTVARVDLFGLFKSFTHIPVPQSFLVLPRRYFLPPIDLAGTRQYQQGGVSLASAVGESDEFVALRDYRPGDPLRRIHWKSWARTGKPVVKEYQDEFFVRHALILDTFVTGVGDEIFEEAVAVAASFACTIQTQDSLLDLMFVGDQAYCFTAGRGLAHTDQMLEILASVNACADKKFDSLKTLVLRHVSSVSGCICILLAWDDERKHFVEFLKSLSVPLRVLVVTEDGGKDLDPGPMKNQPECFHHLRVGRVEEALAAI